MEAVAVKKGITDLNYDQLVGVRNKLTLEIAEQEKVVKALKEKREKVDTEFLRRFNAEGLTSVKTKGGTPYIIKQTSVTVADKVIYREWCKRNDALDFITVSANKTMVVEYVNNKGIVPDGLNWSSRLTIGVKKS